MTAAALPRLLIALALIGAGNRAVADVAPEPSNPCEGLSLGAACVIDGLAGSCAACTAGSDGTATDGAASCLVCTPPTELDTSTATDEERRRDWCGTDSCTSVAPESFAALMLAGLVPFVLRRRRQR